MRENEHVGSHDSDASGSKHHGPFSDLSNLAKIGAIDARRQSIVVARAGLRRTIANVFGYAPKDERGFFDAKYYVAAYPDIASAGVDGFTHFMQYGWREGRNPSRHFSTLFYRDRYLDGAEINPLAHYVKMGGKASALVTEPTEDAFLAVQRTIVNEFFDDFFYQKQVGKIPQDLLTHYLQTGWKEGRTPNATFDAIGYCRASNFVKTLNVSPFYHFVSQTRFLSLASVVHETIDETTGVIPDEVKTAIEAEFDAPFYLRQNRDVREANKNPLHHFLLYGWKEGRDPNAEFDCTYYLARYKSVAESGVNPFFHYLSIGRAEGLRSNPIGRRLYPPLASPSSDDWTRAFAAATTTTADCIVIMPVYKGYDETLAAIHAVLTHRQKSAFALHVINDATPDNALDDALRALADQGLFSYQKNTQNLGFVKSVNTGLRSFGDKEIILLNADTLVFGDWLDRMLDHARRDPSIATITPLSNNATICSYPVVNANNVVELEQPAEHLDRMAASANRGRHSNIPTGVGFCFYMSRASREALGLLDEDAFGRGYGEENDFCLRAAKIGLRNVLAEDIFVYHKGEVSFSELATTASAAAQTVLAGKHPDYAVRIAQHFEADETTEARMRLDLFRLAEANADACFVFIYHGLGGGILTHVEHMESRLREAGTTVVHIRLGTTNRWSIEIRSGGTEAPYCPNLGATAFNQIETTLETFLRWLNPKGIHIHSLANFDWLATTRLMDLIVRSTIPFYYTLHDYSALCHRANLVTASARYCGLPDIETCRACVTGDRSYPEAIDPATRRAAYEAFLERADAVFAPSTDIEARLRRVGVSFPIVVRPHEETWLHTPTVVRSRARRVVDVVTIGAIGPHKGSHVLLSLARDAMTRALPIRYHLIGKSDRDEAMKAANVMVTGSYDGLGEAYDLMKLVQPTCVFLPSIWPETYCYTLSIAFMLNVPPVVFDIGAQNDRVEAMAFGFTLPYRLINDIKDLNDRLCALPYDDATMKPDRHAVTLYPSIVDDYYRGHAAP